MTYRMEILGSQVLRDASGNPVSSVLAQPRRMALLVYLALSDSMVKRDTLLGLFWPEMEQAQGRRALSQAIHFLRRSLGHDAISACGTEDIGLNSDIVECDATSFVRAYRATDLKGAAQAYTGDLLPGFYMSGSAEFDQWLSNTRDALRRQAAEVFWSVAEASRKDGQPVSAATLARRAADLASDNETATRRLMEFLESLEDRAGALEAFETLSRKLQVEYDSAPSKRTRELADRIRAAGRLLAAEHAQTTAEKQATQGVLQRLPWHEIKSHTRTYTGAAIIMVSFISLWGLGTRAGRSEALPSDASIVVDAPAMFDATLRATTASIIADVSAALVAVPRLTVREEKFGVSNEAGGAQYSLKPEVSNHDGQVRVVASITDIGTGKIVKASSFEAPQTDAQALRDMAVDVSEFARKEIGRHMRATRVILTAGKDAHAVANSVLARIRSDSLRDQGLAELALLTLDRADEALAMQLAVHKSAPLFIERAEIARAKNWIYMMPPSRDDAKGAQALAIGIEHAEAAVKADGRNPRAHEMRGLLGFNQWMAIAPGSKQANALRDEAEGYLRKATELDSESPRSWSALAMIGISNGSYSEAYLAAERAHATDAYMEVADAVNSNLFATALETGNMKAARQWCDHITRRARGGWMGAFCELQLIAWQKQPTAADVVRGQNLIAELPATPMTHAVLPTLNAVLAVAVAKSGDVPTASRLIGEAADKSAAMPFVAWALVEMGQRDEGRATLDAFVSKDPARNAGVVRSVRFAALR